MEEFLTSRLNFILNTCGIPISILLIIVLAFRAKYAISFVLKIVRPHGEDIIVTHQVEGVEADDPKIALKKAYAILKEEKRQGKVKGEEVKIYMTRDDKEGKK